MRTSETKIVNTPVALERITKHPDVSRFMSPAPQMIRSCLSRPRTAAEETKLAGRLAHWNALDRCPGLDVLRRLRIAWGNWKRAKANAIEEAPFAAAAERRGGPGAAYEAGLSCGVPPQPRRDYQIGCVRQAIEAGLPRDLELLASAWLGQQVEK
jgi:hypothetical protein